VLAVDEPLSGEPTAACANCESLKIVVIIKSRMSYSVPIVEPFSKLMIEELVSGS